MQREFIDGTCVVLSTYLLHSTLLLGIAWLIIRSARFRSFAVQERLWKWAAVAPLLTVPLQLGANGLNAVVVWQLGDPLLLDVTHGSDRNDSGSALPLTRWETGRQMRSLTTSDLAELPDPTEQLTDSDDRPAPDAAKSQGAPDEVWGIEIVPLDPVGKPEPQALASNTRVTGEESTPTTNEGAESLRRLGQNFEVVANHANDGPGSPSYGVDSRPAARAVGSPVGDVTIVGAPTRTAGATSNWPMLVCLTGFVCVGCGLIRLAFIMLLVRRHLAMAVPIHEGAAHKALRRLCAEYNVRRNVRLFEATSGGEPAAFGFFRTAILLPQGLDQRLSRDELRALLAHELAHVVRHDTAWLWVGRVLTSCLPFQPINFLAARRWRRCSEYLCDAWAVDHGVSGLALAKCLTSVAEWRLAGTSCPGMTAATTSLTSRVERLMLSRELTDRWATGWRHRAVMVTTLLLPLAVTVYGPRTARQLSAAIDQPLRKPEPQPQAQGHSHLSPFAPRKDAAHAVRSSDRSETKSTRNTFTADPRKGALHTVPGNVETLDSFDEKSDLQKSFIELNSSLQRAMSLLEQQEDDPEVSALTKCIRQRIASINATVQQTQSPLRRWEVIVFKQPNYIKRLIELPETKPPIDEGAKK